MGLKIKNLRGRKYLIAAILVAILGIGGGITRALLGGTSSPVSSSDIELQRGLVGWWKMAGNTKDSTPYANNGTNNGATLTSDREGQANSAYSFNGTSSYIQLPNNQYQGQVMTISAWVSINASGALAILGNANSNDYYGYFFDVNNQKIRFHSNSSTGNDLDSVTGSTTLSLNTWYFVSAVTTGSSITVYVNGTVDGSQGSQQTIVYYSTQTPLIGRASTRNQYQNFFNGSIDDLRIYNRALSTAEVATLYKEYNTSLNLDSGESGLAAWWKFDGNAKDSTPNASDGTVNGATLTTDREGQTNSAYSFNGTSNYITASSSKLTSVWNSGEVSVAIWFYNNGTGGTLLRHGQSSTGNGYNGCIYEPNISTTAVSLSGCSGSGTFATYAPISGWNLVVATFDNANSSDKVYLNGSLVGSGTQHTGTAANAVWMFGAGWNIYNTSVTGYLSGSIDEIRVYSRPITSTEATTLYKSYESQISLYGASGGTGGNINLGQGLVGEWDFNGNAKDATPHGNNGAITGATLTSDREGRANSAYLLGNSGAYINVGTPSTYSNLPSAFTYNIWLMRTTSSTYHWPFIMGSTNSHTYFSIRSGNYGDGIYFEWGNSPYDGTSYSGSVTQTLPVNQWHMFTVTYDGSTVKTYWDSVLKSTNTSVTLNPTFGGIYFSQSADDFNGSIDDARAWSRPLSQAEVTALYAVYR